MPSSWPALTVTLHTGAVTGFPTVLTAPLSPSQGTQPTPTYVMRCREQSQNSISMARSCLDSAVSLFRHSRKSFNPPWGPSSQIKAHSLGSRSSRYVRPGKGEKPKLQVGTPAAPLFLPFQWKSPALKPACKRRSGRKSFSTPPRVPTAGAADLGGGSQAPDSALQGSRAAPACKARRSPACKRS